ncbi:hypothetical protein NOVOSPHI9U_20125 [Novosphingobium sp. 9U]|nr:hypothetical protein NOVOSPHI9U_20125 [Novosphingobium sp. 9U]
MAHPELASHPPVLEAGMTIGAHTIKPYRKPASCIYAHDVAGLRAGQERSPATRATAV